LYDARSNLHYCTSAFRDCNSRFLFEIGKMATARFFTLAESNCSTGAPRYSMIPSGQ